MKRNGGASFDLDKRDIILYDGGLFAIEKEICYMPRTRWKEIEKGKLKGCSTLAQIKGKKVKYETYKAYLWTEELRETINYLRRMERMLNSIGYETNVPLNPEFVKKINEVKNGNK